jgi:hypothetical protein
VLDEFGDGSPERPFTDENQPVEAGFLDGPYEPFREGVEIWRVSRQADNLNVCGGESLAECDGEQRIPIVDQIALARQKAVAGIRHVATYLVIQAESGSDVIPAIWTRRVERSMTKSTTNRASP